MIAVLRAWILVSIVSFLFFGPVFAQVGDVTLISVPSVAVAATHPGGDDLHGVDWLRWCETQATGAAAYGNQFSTFWAGGADRDHIDQAVADYRRRIAALGHTASPMEQANALMEATNSVYAPQDEVVYRCRHYARLFRYAALDLGFDNVEYRSYGLAGHAWNRITIGTHRFVVDPRNLLIYEQH